MPVICAKLIPIRCLAKLYLVRRWLCRLLCFSLLLGSAGAHALEHTRGEIKAFGRAYGFYIGQVISLEIIEREFPGLSAQVALSRLMFDTTFGDSLRAIEAELTKTLGANAAQQIASEGRKKLLPILEKNKLSQADAQKFIETVKSRTQGENIEPDVLETLLANKYRANPVAEFTDGWRQRYKTDGSGKSLGLQISMQLPKSWRAKEGERPHIVQKWRSEGGHGGAIIMLMVNDTQEPEPTAADIKAWAKSGELVPEGATLISSRTFSTERRTGVLLEYSHEQERVEMEIYSRNTAYTLFVNGRAVQITCGAYALKAEREAANKAHTLLKPMCQQVMNSVVFPQIY